MSRGVNRVILVGNVGRDPEIRDGDDTKSAMASFTLATTEKWGGKEQTEWHRCTAWGALADVADQYVRKGDKLAIIGRIRYRSYDDKDGVTRYSTNINVDELVMLGSPGGARHEPDNDEGNGGRPDDGGGQGPDAEEPAPSRRGGATESDIPEDRRPSGLKPRPAGSRSAGAKKAVSGRPAGGSAKAGRAKSPNRGRGR